MDVLSLIDEVTRWGPTDAELFARTQAKAEVGLIAGLLIASEQEKRTTLRRSVDSAWKKASRPSLRAWLG